MLTAPRKIRSLRESWLTIELFAGNCQRAHVGKQHSWWKEAPMLTITRAEDAIDGMLIEGRSFREIEDFNSEQPISGELQSVLWLWAWAEQPRVLRRRIIPTVGDDW
jgi:hypothetical protein